MNQEPTPNKHEMADGRLTVGELSRRLEQERSGNGRHAKPEYSVADEFNKVQEAMDDAIDRHNPANKEFQDEMDALDATFAKYGVSESTGRHAAPEQSPTESIENSEALANSAIQAETTDQSNNDPESDDQNVAENDSSDNVEREENAPSNSGDTPLNMNDAYQNLFNNIREAAPNLTDEQIGEAMTAALNGEDAPDDEETEDDGEPRNYNDLVNQVKNRVEQEKNAKSDEELAAAMLEAGHDAEKTDDQIANAMLEVFQEANGINNETNEYDYDDEDDYEDDDDEIEQHEIDAGQESRRAKFGEYIKAKSEALKRKKDRRSFKEAFLAGVGGASEAIKNGTLKTSGFFGKLLSKFKRKKELSGVEKQEAEDEFKDQKMVQYTDGSIALRFGTDGDKLTLGPDSIHKYAKNFLRGGNDLVVVRADSGETDENGQPIMNEYGLYDGYIMNRSSKRAYDILANEANFKLDIGQNGTLPSIGKIGKIINVELRWKSAGTSTYDGAEQSTVKSPFTKYINGAKRI